MGKITGFLNVALFAPIFLSFLCGQALAQQARNDFSWASFVGKTPVALLNGIGGSASCSAPEPEKFFILESLELLTITNFNGWSSPAGAGPLLPRRFESKNISVLRCEFGKRATLIALIQQNDVFSIEISHHRCGDESSPCFRTQSKLDIDTVRQSAKELVVIPGMGSAQLTDAEASQFQRTAGQFEKDTLSKKRFEESTDCFTAALRTKDWHCLAAIRKLNGTFIVSALAEIESGPFWNRKSERYVTHQSFFDLAAEHHAFNEFKVEFNEIVQELRARREVSHQQQEHRDLLLNSTQ